jgi:hypothetical protein
MDKKRNRKLTLQQISAMERAALEQDGVSNDLDVIDAVEKRIYSDLSLTGINFRSLAQTAVAAEVKSRRPDWSQPGFSWFQDDLLIPIDEKGTQVRLTLATEAHLNAYKEIRGQHFGAYAKAEEYFHSHMEWIQENIAGYATLGELMRAQ